MKNVALITGASSGIGKEMALIHAKKSNDLVLVARREQLLDELKSELNRNYGVQIKVIAKDLSDVNSPREIFDILQNEGIEIEYLINNAGFGGHGYFHERKLEKDHSMVNVNITSLMILTKLFLQEMVKRNSGKILNISSTASFLPGPMQSVYYASKAFVTSFSQALAEELRSTSVSVTVLCPGPVETEFFETAQMENTFLLKSQKTSTPEKTATIGYKAMMKGKLVSFDNGLLKFSLRWLIHLLPRKTVLRISRKTMEKSE